MTTTDDHSSRSWVERTLSRWNPALRYIAAAGAVAASLLFRYALRESFGLKVPYLQFYPAVILAAWYGGLGPGIVATGLSALAAMYFLLPPAGYAVGNPADQLSLAVFIGTGVVIAWLNQLRSAEEAQRAAAATGRTR